MSTKCNSQNSFQYRYRPWAIVSGASSGIVLEPATVARQTFKKLGHSRLVVPDAINKFLCTSEKYLQSRRMNTFAYGQVFRRVLRRKLVRSAQAVTHSTN